jgi:hypothetical protein
MEVRFSDGTVRRIASSVPSRRSNVNRSGRQSRKSANGRLWESRVGGTRNLNKAIALPADAELCVVVDGSKLRPTLHVGGSTPCGSWRGGRGA